MPSGFAYQGIEFDDLFDPYVQGTAALCGLLNNGADIGYRYAPASFGTTRGPVGYKMPNGADPASLWAAKGTATYFPANIFASSLSSSGGLQVGEIRIQIKTNGQIHVQTNGTTNGGGGIRNYAPTATGASAPFDFRITGSVAGYRNVSSLSQLTGKGGISFTAGSPGNSTVQAVSTGWITAADDANDFLFFNCRSPSNAGGSELSMSGAGRMKIEVRRKSDQVIVWSSLTAVFCASDSQL